MPLDPPRGACCSKTRRAYSGASTIHFGRLFSSDQTPVTFSNDNPGGEITTRPALS